MEPFCTDPIGVSHIPLSGNNRYGRALSVNTCSFLTESLDGVSTLKNKYIDDFYFECMCKK
jgi:hypothetical protein